MSITAGGGYTSNEWMQKAGELQAEVERLREERDLTEVERKRAVAEVEQLRRYLAVAEAGVEEMEAELELSQAELEHVRRERDRLFESNEIHRVHHDEHHAEQR